MWRILKQQIVCYVRMGWLMWLAIVGIMIGGPWLIREFISLAEGDLNDSSFRPLQFFVTYQGGAFMAIVFGVMAPLQGMRKKLYLLPITTRAITFWIIGCGVVSAIIGNTFLLGTYGYLFNVEWPNFSSTILIVVGLLCLQAAYWSLLEFRFWRLIVATCITGLIVCLAVSRYFPNGLAYDAQPWVNIVWYEWCVLVTLVVASVSLSMRAIARDRCGEAAENSINVNLLKRATSRPEESGKARNAQFLTTPLRAQSWLEWQRTKRIAIIVGCAIGPFALALQAITFTSSSFRLLEGSIGMMVFLPALGCSLIGIGMSDESLNTGKQAEDSWSTLPITDRQISYALLWAAVKACGLTWIILAVSSSIVPLVKLAQHGVEFFETDFDRLWLVKDLGWFAIVLLPMASISMCWIAAASIASVVWSGRQVLVTWSTFALVVLPISCIVSVKTLVPYEYRQTTSQSLFMGFSAITFITVVAIFGLALRNHSLSRRTGIHCGLAWLAVALIICCLPIPLWLKLSWSGIAALIVNPFAFAPQTIAMNRHR